MLINILAACIRLGLEEYASSLKAEIPLLRKLCTSKK
jgi:hypothetical protein